MFYLQINMVHVPVWALRRIDDWTSEQNLLDIWFPFICILIFTCRVIDKSDFIVPVSARSITTYFIDYITFEKKLLDFISVKGILNIKLVHVF